MSAPFAGALFWNAQVKFTDSNGLPLAAGKLYFYVAGTNTPKDTFSDANLTPSTENPNPYILDSNGQIGNPIWLEPGGYDLFVFDSLDVSQSGYDVENLEDVGQTFATLFGQIQAEGEKQVTSGYSQLVTDRLITVDSTGGANPCIINLLPAAEFTQQVTIKNLGTIALSIVPDGTDSLENVNTAFTVPVASGATLPSIMLVSDGVSSIWIQASHGL